MTHPDLEHELARLQRIHVITFLNHGDGDAQTMGFVPYTLLNQLRDHGPMRSSELAERCGLTRGAVSRHITHLQEQGYVCADPDPDDGRAARLGLTEDGSTALQAQADIRRAGVDQVCGAWDERDRAALAGLLQRFNDDVRTAFEQSTQTKQQPTGGRP